ncbi:TPR-containing protein DDB_G0280363-like [Macrobrachium nipponense]|uniref:TPR-containing protein DDB_G0280363-like n=1 Tax=Macrobrachium nipponense TaxID=159736 RepID=UPI0030C8235A
MKLVDLALILAVSAGSWGAETEGQLSTSIAGADTSFYLDSRGAISTLQGATPNDRLQETHEQLIKRFEEEVTQSQLSYDAERNPQPSLNAPYQWAYEVNAASTGDQKSQVELREEDGIVRGRYSVVDPDGSLRVVTYMAHPDDGFQATVDKQVGFQEPIDTESLIVLAYTSEGRQDQHNFREQIASQKQLLSSGASQRQTQRINQQGQFSQLELQQQQSRNQREYLGQQQGLQLKNSGSSTERRQNYINQSVRNNQPQKQSQVINQQINYRNQQDPSNSQTSRSKHQYGDSKKLPYSRQGHQASLVHTQDSSSAEQQQQYYTNDKQLQINHDETPRNYHGTTKRNQNNQQSALLISRQTLQGQEYRAEKLAQQQHYNNRDQNRRQYSNRDENRPQINNRDALRIPQNYESDQLTQYRQQQNSQNKQTAYDVDNKSVANYEIHTQANLKLKDNGVYNIVPIILRRVRQTEADEE